MGTHIPSQPFQFGATVHPVLRPVDNALNTVADKLTYITDPNLDPTVKKIYQEALPVILGFVAGIALRKRLSAKQFSCTLLASATVTVLPLPHLVRQFACTRVSHADLSTGDRVIAAFDTTCWPPGTDPNMPAFIRGVVSEKTASQLTLTHDDGSTSTVPSQVLSRLTFLKEPAWARLADSCSFAGLSPIHITPSTALMVTVTISVLALGKNRVMKSLSTLAGSATAFLIFPQVLSEHGTTRGWVLAAQERIVKIMLGGDETTFSPHLLTAHHGGRRQSFTKSLMASIPEAWLCAHRDITLDMSDCLVSLLHKKATNPSTNPFSTLTLDEAPHLLAFSKLDRGELETLLQQCPIRGIDFSTPALSELLLLAYDQLNEIRESLERYQGLTPEQKDDLALYIFLYTHAQDKGACASQIKPHLVDITYDLSWHANRRDQAYQIITQVFGIDRSEAQLQEQVERWLRFDPGGQFLVEIQFAFWEKAQVLPEELEDWGAMGAHIAHSPIYLLLQNKIYHGDDAAIIASCMDAWQAATDEEARAELATQMSSSFDVAEAIASIPENIVRTAAPEQQELAGTLTALRTAVLEARLRGTLSLLGNPENKEQWTLNNATELVRWLDSVPDALAEALPKYQRPAFHAYHRTLTTIRTDAMAYEGLTLSQADHLAAGIFLWDMLAAQAMPQEAIANKLPSMLMPLIGDIPPRRYWRKVGEITSPAGEYAEQLIGIKNRLVLQDDKNWLQGLAPENRSDNLAQGRLYFTESGAFLTWVEFGTQEEADVPEGLKLVWDAIHDHVDQHPVSQWLVPETDWDHKAIVACCMTVWENTDDADRAELATQMQARPAVVVAMRAVREGIGGTPYAQQLTALKTAVCEPVAE